MGLPDEVLGVVAGGAAASAGGHALAVGTTLTGGSAPAASHAAGLGGSPATEALVQPLATLAR